MSHTNAVPIKVLYLHGIAETADSPKPASLSQRDYMTVNCPDLSCHFFKKNGPLVGMLMSPWFQFTVFIGICFGELMHNHGEVNEWWMIVMGGIFAQLVACWFVRIQLFQGAVSNSKAWTLAIAKYQLAVFKPDVVVGFSWGGALAVHMLIDKTWDGPMVLLAPAQRVLATTKEQEKADAWVLRAHKCSDDADGDDGNSDGVDEHTSTTGEERPWVIVVHSKEDQVVNYEHSVQFCKDNNFSLETVESGPHSMMGLARTGLLAELVCKAAKDKR